MFLIKKIFKNKKKLIYIKSSLPVIYILLIYLSECCKDFANNSMYRNIYKKLKSEHFFNEENIICNKYDPIFLMAERFKKPPIIICNNKESMHKCYQNSKFGSYNSISKSKYGVICQSENVILNPLKSNQTN